MLYLLCVLERRIHLNKNEFIEENQETEIDLKALFLKFKSLWYLILLGAVAGLFVSILYGKFMTTPMYSSSTMIYLRGSSSSVNLQDLQLGSELTSDYGVIFKSRPNLENVITNLNLDMSPSQLSGMITVSNPADTHILKVTVTSTDPNLSANIANEVAENGMQTVREIDSQEPYVIERAITGSVVDGTTLVKRGVMGAVAGIVLVMFAIFLRFTFADTVSSTDDVETVLGVPVLTVVVEDRNLNYVKKNAKKR